jgi:hypothetical protein
MFTVINGSIICKCGSKFTTVKGATRHAKKQHSNGAIARRNGMSLFSEMSLDHKYELVCDAHGYNVGFDNLAIAKGWLSTTTSEFCDVCSGKITVCETCGDETAINDVNFGRVIEHTAAQCAASVASYNRVAAAYGLAVK